MLNIVTEFIEEFKAKYGEHVHVLDWALHLDESTPHIHERHVFDCENKYGEIAPQQEKAPEALGFNLPDPTKPLSRRNNRKITFDAACRKMLFEIAKRHGLELEEEAEYGNRKYLEKQDFILAKQKEQLAAQQNKLDELTLKVNDMEKYKVHRMSCVQKKRVFLPGYRRSVTRNWRSAYERNPDLGKEQFDVGRSRSLFWHRHQ